jgi:hypothetical protein
MPWSSDADVMKSESVRCPRVGCPISRWAPRAPQQVWRAKQAGDLPAFQISIIPHGRGHSSQLQQRHTVACPCHPRRPPPTVGDVRDAQAARTASSRSAAPPHGASSFAPPVTLNPDADSDAMHARAPHSHCLSTERVRHSSPDASSTRKPQAYIWKPRGRPLAPVRVNRRPSSVRCLVLPNAPARAQAHPSRAGMCDVRA